MKAADLISELQQAGHDGAVIFFCDGNRVTFSETIFTAKLPTNDPYDDTVSVVEIWLEKSK